MSQESTEAVSHDVAFDLLSNARRRFVLRRLQTTERIELSALARELAAFENGVAEEDVTAEQRKRAYVSLYQTHVPKLEDAGVVTYGHDGGVVRPTGRLADLTTYFEAAGDRPPWRSLYVAFCAGGLLAFAIAYAVDLGAVPARMVGLGVLVGLSLFTLVYYLAERRRRHEPVPIPVSRG